jgi:hypothetical protein
LDFSGLAFSGLALGFALFPWVLGFLGAVF